MAYARRRRAVGRSVSEFQLIREKNADMKSGINA